MPVAPLLPHQFMPLSFLPGNPETAGCPVGVVAPTCWPRGLGREELSLTAEPVLLVDVRAAFERLQNIPRGAELREGPEKARLLGEQHREGSRRPKQQQGPHLIQRRALGPKDTR